MKFTQVPADTFKQIQLNAGVIAKAFTPATGTLQRSDIIGATSGGCSFEAVPEYTDFGEDIDNVPANTKELKRQDSVAVTMSGSFVTISEDMAELLAGSADAANGKITPRADLDQSDFKDIWWIGDYSDVNVDTEAAGGGTGASAGFIAIHVINALNTGGFKLQSNDKGKGTFDFEITGHYSIADMSVVPYEVYVKTGTPAA